MLQFVCWLCRYQPSKDDLLLVLCRPSDPHLSANKHQAMYPGLQHIQKIVAAPFTHNASMDNTRVSFQRVIVPFLSLLVDEGIQYCTHGMEKRQLYHIVLEKLEAFFGRCKACLEALFPNGQYKAEPLPPRLDPLTTQVLADLVLPAQLIQHVFQAMYVIITHFQDAVAQHEQFLSQWCADMQLLCQRFTPNANEQYIAHDMRAQLQAISKLVTQINVQREREQQRQQQRALSAASSSSSSSSSSSTPFIDSDLPGDRRKC